MKIELKLIVADIVRHPARLILSSLGMIAATCLVVWVVSGYDALVAQFSDSARKTLGRYDMLLVSGSDNLPELSEVVLDLLREDPAIAEIEAVVQVPVKITRADWQVFSPFGTPAPAMRRAPGDALKNTDNAAEMPKRRRADTGLSSGEAPSQNRRENGAPKGIRAQERPPGGQPEIGVEKAGGSDTASAPQGAPPRRPRMPFGVSVLVGTSAVEAPFDLESGAWLSIPSGTGKKNETVLSSAMAEQLRISVGDEIVVALGAKKLTLNVAGILAQSPMTPEMSPGKMPSPKSLPRGPSRLSAYVSMKTAEEILGGAQKPSFAYLRLEDEADSQAFVSKWRRHFSENAIADEILDTEGLEDKLEEGRNASSAKMQSYSATGMSLMASIFIILTTLSMGVSERSRQFAMLRAVALTRMQIAGMIAFESLLFGLIGWIGGLGAGWVLLKFAVAAKADLFQNGAHLGSTCIMLTGASAFGGAVAASAIPAWKATRISPLEAFAPIARIRPFRTPLFSLIAALVLISVNPLLIFVFDVPDQMRYLVHAGIGYSCMGLGFILLIPMAMLVVEKFLGPLIASLLFFDKKLLKSQLTGNMWRTLGTTVSLSIGLSLFFSTMTWGYTMLQPFVPGDWVPDMLVSFQRGGIPDSEFDQIKKLKGVKAGECIPLAVEQVFFSDDITASEERSSVTRQDNVIMIGLDPEKAFGGNNPVLRPNFKGVSREECIRMLGEGRYCIVPDHFLPATGLKIGDSFKVLPPDSQSPVEYKIAGTVSLPGWHWMTKFSGLRRRSGRSAAMVFTKFENVRNDFKINKTNFIWSNLEKDADTNEIGIAIQKIAEEHAGEKAPVNAQGTWAFGASNFGDSLRLSTREDVRDRIAMRADSMIWGMCQIPLITLLISSLAVVNTVTASVRARRWEMGILRSIGMTRFGLIRLIVAESLLIGILACLISAAFGVTAGYFGTAISQYMSFFGGLETRFFVPWAKITLGSSFTLGLCLLAALWPAALSGMQEPLKLLSDGRTSI